VNPTNDLLLSELYQSSREPHEHQLAARYAPFIRFDAREPFLPIAAGITVFNSDSTSPSMRRTIRLAPPGKPAASLAIEYAIWWDWDIHHLYELEHIWVYLDANGKVVRVEGSWHGKFNELALQIEGDHPVVLSEPGKHACAAQRHSM
jgi:putative hydrolase of the HAD superfamily